MTRIVWYSALVLLVLTAAVAQDQPEVAAAIATSARNFKFEVFQYPETPQAPNEFTQFTSMSDAGAVVGAIHLRKTISDQAFLYERGTYTLLAGPLYKGNFTRAIAINNRGRILLGQDPQSSGAPPRYFLYDIARKTFRSVGPFIRIAGAPDKIRLRQINGFNDQEQFVGSFTFQGNAVGGYGTLVIGPEGSLALPADAADFKMIACPAGLGAANALGINNHAQVTGSCGPSPAGVTSGFIYSNSAITLFAYPESQMTQGRSINDTGAVAGIFRLKAVRPGLWPGIGFVYDGSRFMPVAQDSNSTANGIDNRGRIAGGSGGVGFIAAATPANPLRLSAAGR